jgi:micrococcal nuclease
MIRIFSKRSAVFFIFVAALLILSAPLSLAGQYRVTHVTGGSTIQVISDHITLTVLLAGIEVPMVPRSRNQLGQPPIEAATTRLEKFVLNKDVKIIPYVIDPLGRTLAEVFVDNQNVNIEMLKAGYAQVYRGDIVEGLDIETYWDAEKEARIAGRGMWVFWAYLTKEKRYKALQN